MIAHSLFECVTLVACSLIALISFTAYFYCRYAFSLYLGMGFLAIAIGNVAHAFIYPANFALQNIILWLETAGTFVGATFIALGILREEEVIDVKIATAQTIRHLSFILVSFALFLGVNLTIAFSQNLNINLPPAITPLGGTLLKTLFGSYTLIVFLITTFLMTRGYLRTKNPTTLLFAIALFLFAITRVGYIAMNHFYDIYHWTAHYLKALASLFLLAAICKTLITTLSTQTCKSPTEQT